MKNEKTITSQKVHAYQQKINFINFVVTTTRLNVIVVSSKLTEYFTNFFEHHAKQTNRTLKYLTHTKNYVIIFDDQINNTNIIFLNFSNVSFVDDINIRQNFNEYCFKFFDDFID